MHTWKHSVLTRLLATLLAVVMMIGIVGYVPEARAAKSFTVGNATVTADCISHATAVRTANADLSCNNLQVGVGKHQCCWGYTAALYKQIWGTNFNYSDSASKNNLLRNLDASKRLCTAENLKKFFAQTKPGAVLRIDAVSSPAAADGANGHTMLFLALGSDGNGGYFYEGNYNGKGNTQIVYHSWTKIANYGKKYIKYIYWKGAPTYTEDYSTVDNLSRTGISIKPASGEDQCYIKEKPFEDSNNKAPSVPKGDTVKIVGAVKNKHGNIWYKTEDGGFVYSGDIIFFQDYFSISAKFKNTEKRSARKYPFEDSDAVKKIGKDDIVQVSRFVLNSYGNIWAQLTDGSYLCFYDKNSGENKLKFSAHVTQPTHSTTYPQGNIKVTSNYGFLFKGDVKAEVPFLSLTARVIDRETEQDVSATGSPCTLKPGSGLRTINLEKTKIDGKTMDNIVLIRKLNGSSGWYRYELNAQFGFTYEGKTFKFGNEYNFVSSNFSVGKAGETEPNFSTDPFDQFSSLFTLSAKFKNTEKRSSHESPYLDSPKVKTIGKSDIVEVTEFVTNSHGNIWAKLTDGSYLCFYDQETGENKMKFSAHVTEPSHSTTYPEGDIKVTANYGFLFKGDVKAEVPFLSLTARVIDRETEQDVSATGSPCTLKPGSGLRTINLEKTKIDGKTMDNIVLIRKLNGSSGWYRYELNAQFGFTYEGKTFKFGNEYNFVSSNFTVGNPGELEPAPTPEPPGGEEEPPAGDEGGRVPGDATDDGMVDLRDALRIMKRLCGWDVTMNEINADCTGDGMIDLRDALRIMKYLCGWDVVLV